MIGGFQFKVEFLLKVLTAFTTTKIEKLQSCVNEVFMALPVHKLNNVGFVHKLVAISSIAADIVDTI